MSVYIFYHIFCNENTPIIVKEQLQNIMFSGLYYNIDKIYCFLLGSHEHRNLLKTTVIDNYGSKITVADESDDVNLYERFTLLRIKKFIKPEDKLLYIHSKGITKFNTQYYKNVLDWRIYMEMFLFTQSHNIIRKLDQYDLAGSMYRGGDKPHFSGNFWWSTGKYYLTLPDHIDPHDYFAPEMYVFKGSYSPKFCILDECNNYFVENYTCVFPAKHYIDKYIIDSPPLPQPSSPPQNTIKENIDTSIKNIDKSIEIIKKINSVFTTF